MKISSTTIPLTDHGNNYIQAMWHFALALILSERRDLQSLAINMGLPVFMLLAFWLPSLGAQGEEADLLLLMFPAIATLCVLMPGHIQATRLARWREQGIFARLMLTPVPLSCLMLGATLVPVSMGVGLGMLMIAFASPIVGISLSFGIILVALGIMFLVSVTFSNLGLLLAAVIDRSDVAGYTYFFAIVPLFFLGSFPAAMLPPLLNVFTPWLPTSMAVSLVNALVMEGGLGGDAFVQVFGLGCYAGVFSAFGIHFFRWE